MEWKEYDPTISDVYILKIGEYILYLCFDKIDNKMYLEISKNDTEIDVRLDLISLNFQKAKIEAINVFKNWLEENIKEQKSILEELNKHNTSKT
jgi:hypothetical protein